MNKYKKTKIILIILIVFFAILLITGLICFRIYNKNQKYKLYESAKQVINDGHYKTGIDKIEELLDNGDIPDKQDEAEDVIKDAKEKLADKYYNEGRAEDAYDLYAEIESEDGMDKSKILECEQYIKEDKQRKAEQIIEGHTFYHNDKATAKELKYKYCKENQDSSNKTMAKYLWSLVKAKYKDAKKLNNKIFEPYVKITVNDKENDDEHEKTNVSVYKTMYFHFIVKGLNPYDTKGFRTKWVYNYPDGTSEVEVEKHRCVNDDCSWGSVSCHGNKEEMTGPVKFTIYDWKGNLLGTDTGYFE